jgi:hypothetical protein
MTSELLNNTEHTCDMLNFWNAWHMRDPKQLLDYRPIGRKRPRQPLKRLQERYDCEAETIIYWSNFITRRRRKP